MIPISIKGEQYLIGMRAPILEECLEQSFQEGRRVLLEAVEREAERRKQSKNKL